MQAPIRHDDLNIRIPLGPALIDIIYINYEPSIPSWGYPNHCHSSYELHFITQGKGVLEVYGKRFEIKPGTFYLTGPGVYHKQQADDEEPMDEFCINFEIKVRKRKQRKNDTFLTSEINEILETLLNTNFWFGLDGFDTIPLFRSVMQEFEKQMLGHYTVIQSLATHIIIHAIRNFSQSGKSNTHIPKKIPYDSRRFLVDNYFQVPSKEMSSHALAAKIGVSIRQLERLMKLYYGVTFKEKLHRTRLKKAKDLLINTKLTSAAIAEHIGYTSSSYFTKCFRQYTGTPPLEYRTQRVNG